ncbi:MAG: DUF2721 domain-containing protein [Pseudomonadota bacterium]
MSRRSSAVYALSARCAHSPYADTASRMQTTSAIIQLSLAPVFLLVAIGQILNAVTARLARVVDRSRVLTARLQNDPGCGEDAQVRAELRGLGWRMRFANLAAAFLSTAAVCVCVVVTLLFVDSLVAANLEWLIVSLFMFTMGLITGGLVTFLGEVSVATTHLRLDPTLTRQTPSKTSRD